MFFSSIKGINRLISKGMSNIYLKVTIQKKMYGFSIILILKGIMTFKVQESMHFGEQKYKL